MRLARYGSIRGARETLAHLRAELSFGHDLVFVLSQKVLDDLFGQLAPRRWASCLELHQLLELVLGNK
jgi:hypothetical protein